VVQNNIVDAVIAAALSELDEERREQIAKIAADVTLTGDVEPLRHERDHWARMTADCVADETTTGDAARYAGLYRYAHGLLMAYFKSDEFAVRAGAVRELRRPVEVTDTIEAGVDVGIRVSQVGADL